VKEINICVRLELKLKLDEVKECWGKSAVAFLIVFRALTTRRVYLLAVSRHNTQLNSRNCTTEIVCRVVFD
jgi:hypothetical protein